MHALKFAGEVSVPAGRPSGSTPRVSVQLREWNVLQSRVPATLSCVEVGTFVDPGSPTARLLTAFGTRRAGRRRSGRGNHFGAAAPGPLRGRDALRRAQSRFDRTHLQPLPLTSRPRDEIPSGNGGI
jgi:hypothetical protein